MHRERACRIIAALRHLGAGAIPGLGIIEHARGGKAAQEIEALWRWIWRSADVRIAR